MSQRKFRVWREEYDEEADGRDFEAWNHEDAAREGAESFFKDCYDTTEAVVNVRELVPEDADATLVDKDEDYRPGTVVKFDVSTEYSRSWVAEEHHDPPPETEEAKASRRALIERIDRESAERRAHNSALAIVSNIGTTIAQCLFVKERLEPLGFGDDQILAVIEVTGFVNSAQQMHRLRHF